jgi:mannitol-1-phosphate 5-dehydrogenase
VTIRWPDVQERFTVKRAVIFGGGNIGRGFIGQLFSESGYRVTFVDVDQMLIDALNAQCAYAIHLVDNDLSRQVRVAPVGALHANQVDTVVKAVSRAEVMATAVGARALTVVAPRIAAGISERAAAHVDAPLNCIVCENLKGAASILRGVVREHLSASERTYLDARVGFVDAVIGRMVPPLTAEMREANPTTVFAEPYKELPVDRNGFVGPVPRIESMIPCDDFELYTARKLYVHNCGHAVLAYLGYLKAYVYGYEALADGEIDACLRAAWRESIAGQVAHYGANADWLQAHALDLRRRFANRALGDTIYRLGRDPIRKLGPDDRLVAPARLAEAAGETPSALARAIAAAMRFSSPEDPMAVDLKTRLARQGLDAVLYDVCQIKPDEPLGTLVRRNYARILERAWPR